MNHKLVIAGVGGFGLGALISWAITADRLELKARNNRAGFRKVIEGQQKTIWALQDGKTMEEILSGSAESDEDHTRLLEDLRPHELSLDKEPNAFGEGLEWVMPDGSTRTVGGEDEGVVLTLPFEATAEGQELQAAYEENDDVDEVEYEQQRANLKAQIAKYIDNPDDRDVFIEQAVAIEANRKDPPFVVSKALYAWDEEEGNNYEKTTLTFYPRERLLVDEDDEAIDAKDVNEYVGWKNLDRFGDQSEDADVVYIRNRRLSTDFEVVRTDEQLPAHVKYGMDKQEYQVQKAAGRLKFEEE